MINNRFLNPPGRGFGLFLLKFFLFSIVAWILWLGIRLPYNILLKSSAQWMCDTYFETIDYRYTTERGTFEVMIKPDRTAPFQLIKANPVSIKIFFNTLHFNLIPFIALILASPLVSWRRFCLFFVFGFIFLFLTHQVHLLLDLKGYYYNIQKEQGYFQTGEIQVTQNQLAEMKNWQYRTNLWSTMQGFMEQAGSMIFPAFIWMIYASSWIFGAFLQVNKPPEIKESQPSSQAKP